MLRATLQTARRRSSPSIRSTPSWFQERVVPILQSITRRACTHPIHTIVFVAILASTTYLGLLESSLFEPPPSPTSLSGQTDISNLLVGSKTLFADKSTSWKWQNGDESNKIDRDTVSQNLALFTLVFPDSNANGRPVSLPQPETIDTFNDSSVHILPSSKNMYTSVSQESTIAVSVPYNSAPRFVDSVRELPLHQSSDELNEDQEIGANVKHWQMTIARGASGKVQRSFRRRVADAWTAFVDLLKNAEELDIVIMALGYISMHLTFVSLFTSLRRLGSNYWLASTVLLSSAFALLFGLIVTIKLGVPLNMVLLSEGLPFLVVTIGFEKPIILTKAVRSAAVTLRRPSTVPNQGGTNKNPSTIHSAVQMAMRERSYELIRDYSIEILILLAGSASGVQGGLCQFCFLAAWILFFDCILLFTFYTAILTIKLEIGRIKSHVALRRALVEEGVSRKVAEEVAAGDEWPATQEVDGAEPAQLWETTIFGMKAGDTTVSRFKVLMVAGFIGINVINFCTAPFRSGARSAASALSSVVTHPPMDADKVAGNGLEAILSAAKHSKLSTVVTVFTPIKYHPETAFSSAYDGDSNSFFDMDFADQLLNGIGGKFVDGVLKSFEDPLLSKWIIIALAMSIILNGYLFNAARWTIRDPARPNERRSTFSQARGALNGLAIRPSSPQVLQTPEKPLPVPEVKEPAASPEAVGDELPRRSPEECEAMLKEKKGALIHDEDLVSLALRGKIALFAFEATVGDNMRAVEIRRKVVSRTAATKEFTGHLENSLVPYKNYNYDKVFGACCENVIGYLPLPLGVAGPLVVDGNSYFIPMATTEGVLVASTSRGAKAINSGGGAVTVVTADGMTRGPCVGFESLARAAEAKLWIDSEVGTRVIKTAFDSTSRFARLKSLKTALAGTYLYIRFKTTTGDAMGMNMISKGVEKALGVMSEEHGFADMAIISVSGNFCMDKKPAALNWVDGRGKSVVAEAIIPGEVVTKVLKSNVDALVELNISKNLIGSAMAGSVGGFNAHASNIVAAMFLALGQDPAQVVESSHCITVMKNNNGNLQISVSMPCIEVGTVGGGTFLPPQEGILDMLGVRGAHQTAPGTNSRQLSRIIAAAVLAGELSLCSALAAGHLVRAHMQHNRSQVPTRATTPSPAAQNGSAVPPSTLGMTSVLDTTNKSR